ncbi:MAG: Fur family transcriptional regulator [Candidatus Competibacterales bacterium]
MAASNPPSLTPGQRRILAALRASKTPLTAYAVLEVLRQERAGAAPPSAYRALNRLMALGLVHRLESLNAYIACEHHHHGEHALFLICDDCGVVTERIDPGFSRGLSALAATVDFAPQVSMVEIHGQCPVCRGSRNDHAPPQT